MKNVTILNTRSCWFAAERVGRRGRPGDFLAMMIPHHQGTVEMARLVLVHGRDPLTRHLAEEIIASQQIEIASMQERLRALANGPARDRDEFPALSGTRDDRPRVRTTSATQRRKAVTPLGRRGAR